VTYKRGDFVREVNGLCLDSFGDKFGYVMKRGRFFRRGQVLVCTDYRYPNSCTKWFPDFMLCKASPLPEHQNDAKRAEKRF
jgi:hypothetical protein